MAAEQVLLRVICQHEGALNYEDLEDFASGLGLVDHLDSVVENSELFSVVEINGSKRVIAKTKVRRCTAQDCDANSCNDLHLCKFYLFGTCKRRRCAFGHNLNSEHNFRVLTDNQLNTLSKQEIQQLLMQNDNSFLPQVCNFYNKGNGTYGNCRNKESCRMLHMCDNYISGTCPADAHCSRSHDFKEPHPRKTLLQRGVPDSLVASLPPVYRNIQAMKRGWRGPAANKSSNSHSSSWQNDAVRNEICLFYVKGNCTQGDKCWRTHFKMPYKWEVKDLQTWTELVDNEAIERDYCNPSKIKSEGADQVCFDSMTCGHREVRRLSTPSSTQSSYVLTTKWAWYWLDEYGNWIKYGSIKEMHGLPSIDSESLEKKYQEDPSAVMMFEARQQTYELNFQDMMQENIQYGTKRTVRRRPVFVSSADAQAARARTNGPHRAAQNAKGLPGFWDKSAIPDIGYKTVILQNSDRDYQRVQERFKRTMSGFRIVSIERVQNPDLWEDFQKKRDRMKRNNGDKNSRELLLFHGTDSKYLDSICKENFDWRRCGKNGTVYGKGSYFARDSNYSHSYTSSSGLRTMFACRVLVGDYTLGDSDLCLPPQKDEGNSSAYDSCVDNVIKPSIYVVFDRNQAYPEFLIKYDDGIGPMPTTVPSSSTNQPVQTTYPGNSQILASTATKQTSVRVQHKFSLSPSHKAHTTPASLAPLSVVTSSISKPAEASLTPIQTSALSQTAQMVDDKRKQSSTSGRSADYWSEELAWARSNTDSVQKSFTLPFGSDLPSSKSQSPVTNASLVPSDLDSVRSVLSKATLATPTSNPQVLPIGSSVTRPRLSVTAIPNRPITALPSSPTYSVSATMHSLAPTTSVTTCSPVSSINPTTSTLTPSSTITKTGASSPLPRTLTPSTITKTRASSPPTCMLTQPTITKTRAPSPPVRTLTPIQTSTLSQTAQMVDDKQKQNSTSDKSADSWFKELAWARSNTDSVQRPFTLPFGSDLPGSKSQSPVTNASLVPSDLDSVRSVLSKATLATPTSNPQVLPIGSSVTRPRLSLTAIPNRPITALPSSPTYSSSATMHSLAPTTSVTTCSPVSSINPTTRTLTPSSTITKTRAPSPPVRTLTPSTITETCTPLTPTSITSRSLNTRPVTVSHADLSHASSSQASHSTPATSHSLSHSSPTSTYHARYRSGDSTFYTHSPSGVVSRPSSSSTSASDASAPLYHIRAPQQLPKMNTKDKKKTEDKKCIIQ